MYDPILIFLSEPQIYYCDITEMFSMFSGKFSFSLNSEDSFCPSLPLESRAAKGGTMVMWKTDISPYVRVLPTTSPSVLPIYLSIPGVEPTAHITIYLPTQGREAEYVNALASLETCILQVYLDFACPIYIRGDANTNPKNASRVELFTHFCSKYSLISLNLRHSTHHHFQGEGASDSQLDVLLYTGPPAQSESLESIVCSLENPLVQSHHDIVLSSFSVPRCTVEASSGNLRAPRIPNNRVKIKWNNENLPAYKSLVSPSLSSLRERWAGCPGPAATSVLLALTNEALSLAAQTTNRYIDLGKPYRAKPSVNPAVKKAQRASLVAARSLRALSAAPLPDPAAIIAARQVSAEARASLQCRIFVNVVNILNDSHSKYIHFE